MRMIDIAGWVVAGTLALAFAATQLPNGGVPAPREMPLTTGKGGASTNLTLADPEMEAQFDYALGLFRDSRWSASYGLLCELADHGHPGAARIALFMAHHGQPLFGSERPGIPS